MMKNEIKNCLYTDDRGKKDSAGFMDSKENKWVGS